MGVRSQTRAILKMTGCTFTYPGQTKPQLNNVSAAVSLSSRVGIGEFSCSLALLYSSLTFVVSCSRSQWSWKVDSHQTSHWRDAPGQRTSREAPEFASRLCRPARLPPHRGASREDPVAIHSMAIPRWTRQGASRQSYSSSHPRGAEADGRSDCRKDWRIEKVGANRRSTKVEEILHLRSQVAKHGSQG